MIIHFYDNYIGFGDIISSVSYSILFSDLVYYHKATPSYIPDTVKSLLPHFKSLKPFSLTDKEPTHRGFCVQDHREAYAPTKLQWKYFELKRKSKKKIICYQLESPGNPAWNGSRFFTNQEKLDFKKLQIKLLHQVEFIPLGRPKSIEENIKILAESEFFLGIDSGMSHLAHAVGTPCYLKDFCTRGGFGNGCLDFYHPNKQYTKFNTFKDIIPKILELA